METELNQVTYQSGLRHEASTQTLDTEYGEFSWLVIHIVTWVGGMHPLGQQKLHVWDIPRFHFMCGLSLAGSDSCPFIIKRL